MPDKLSLRTYAKINLTLDVTGKREDGYHNIDSIFEEISLYDVVSVSIDNSEKITVLTSNPEIPCDEKNIAYKAAAAFFEAAKLKNPGIKIFIEKNIPSQAGMGGGSTNAAGVMVILNKMFEAGLSDSELMKAALPVGADTPFFIQGGLAHITGIGELESSLKPLSEHYIVCAKGDEGVSTPLAYKEIDRLTDIPHQDTDAVLKAVKEDNISDLMSNSLNTFELTSLPDDIDKIKNILNKHHAVKAMMTGSGAAVFGIFTDKDSADKAYKELDEKFSFAGVYTNICDRSFIF